MQTIKKASHSMFHKVNAVALAKTGKDSMHVLRVAGLAVDVKSGATSYGDYFGLVGNFTCVNPATGEAVKASTLFLPEVAMAPLVAAVKMGGTPQFAFDIFANVDEKSPVGFSYSLQDLAPQENDPIAALLAGAPKLALAAPEAAADAPAKSKGKTK